MASSKTRTKTIRIANETEEYFEGLPLNRIVECVHGLMECGHLKWNGEELTGEGGNWDLPEEVMNDTESMGEFFNMTLGELVTEFNRMLNEGEISSEDKKLYCVLPNWAQEMADACHDAGVSVESVGKKVTGMIQRGQI